MNVRSSRNGFPAPKTTTIGSAPGEELGCICSKVAFERFDKQLEAGLEAKIVRHIEQCHAGDIAKHNGGLAVNLVEAAIDNHAERMADYSEAHPEATRWGPRC